MPGEVRPDSADPYATLGDRLRPCETAGGQREPGGRVHFHHIRWRAAGVSRAGHALHGTVRWDAHLHRSAGGALREDGQEGTDRFPVHRPFGRTPLVQRRQCRDHSGGLNVRRGHDGTIRPGIGSRDAGPGSRSSGQTRHSCRRRIRTVMIPGPAPAAGEVRPEGGGRVNTPTCLEASGRCGRSAGCRRTARRPRHTSPRGSQHRQRFGVAKFGRSWQNDQGELHAELHRSHQHSC